MYGYLLSYICAHVSMAFCHFSHSYICSGTHVGRYRYFLGGDTPELTLHQQRLAPKEARTRS